MSKGVASALSTMSDSDSNISETTLVRVTFTPKGVKPIHATELREVVFPVEGNVPTQMDLFEKARGEAIEQDVISKDAVYDHWEPYKHESLN